MAKNKNNRDFIESLRSNSLSYRFYYDRLTELATSMFDWKLPDTINKRFLELTLYTQGKALIFEDEAIGLLALPFNGVGDRDLYGEPLTRYAYGRNGYHAELTAENSVIIYNNYLRTNTENDIRIYAKRLYDLDMVIDINAKAQKTPITIVCEEDQLLTCKNAYLKYEGNQPVIIAGKGFDPNSIKAFSTGAPYVGDKIYQLKNQIWNEALTHIGISNVNYNKKERLISDEVIRSQGGTIASRYSRLDMRQEGAAEATKMFGAKYGEITCEYKEDTAIKEFVDTINVNKEGDEDNE